MANERKPELVGAESPRARIPRNKLRDATSKAAQGYRWVDKDPILDLVMSKFRDSPHSYETLAWASGMSDTTLRNWDSGKTRHPQHQSVVRVMLALGAEFGIHDFGTVGGANRSPATDYYANEVKRWQRSRISLGKGPLSERR